MNYLAHAYLSFNDPEILVGNMISDFVKGKKKFDYPLRIQAGIMLHRIIDEFTDGHPATREELCCESKPPADLRRALDAARREPVSGGPDGH